MGDWNAILDPKIDKVRWGASGLGRCESSLVSLVAHHDLVDRFCFGSPREGDVDVAKVGSYLDSVRRVDSDFVSCPMFHSIAWTDHKLASVSLR